MPNAARMQVRLLFGLLHSIVAGLTEGLKVVFVPELALVATVRLDVVADELAGIAFEAFALAACE